MDGGRDALLLVGLVFLSRLVGAVMICGFNVRGSRG